MDFGRPNVEIGRKMASGRLLAISSTVYLINEGTINVNATYIDTLFSALTHLISIIPYM